MSYTLYTNSYTHVPCVDKQSFTAVKQYVASSTIISPVCIVLLIMIYYILPWAQKIIVDE